MLKIFLIVGSLGTISCRILTKPSDIERNLKTQGVYTIDQRAVREIPYCENVGICNAIDAIKASMREILSLFFAPTANYGKDPSDTQERSYYSGYGSPTTPTYYPAFDPLSVLASLAFLAFLLQSFASLFDRSRSILSTTVAARESTPLENYETLGITKRVLGALEKYENGKRKSIARRRRDWE